MINRQQQAGTAAAQWAAVQHKLPAVFFGDGVDNGQPQPGAFARWLGGKEGLEQLLAAGFGQAWAVVVNINAQLPLLLTELHLQALFAGLQGVAQQVEQGQLQTARVAFDRGQRLRAVGLQLQLPPGDFQLGRNGRYCAVEYLAQ